LGGCVFGIYRCMMPVKRPMRGRNAWVEGWDSISEEGRL
jgi:hypothetical protein